MPCEEKRARYLMERKAAKVYWQKGIFCIKLLREPSNRKYQAVAVGIDPGSKREGYTVLTEKAVVLNITTDTPNWVKDHVEARRILRRARRTRKTPYRACRENRGALRNAKRVSPSTKSRWDAKLRIIKLLFKILPITVINVEDIQAITRPGKKKWNISFSPLEVGKKYFEEQIAFLYPHITFIKTKGIETSKHRKLRGFAKSKSKLDYTWSAHNSDSHSLAELALQENIEPNFNLYKIEFLEYHRRMLHRQNFSSGGKRSKYGSTVSAEMPRGSVMRDLKTNELCYLGGCSKEGFVAIHSIATKQRIKQYKKLEELQMLYCSKYAVQFISQTKNAVRNSSPAIQGDGGGFLARD